MKLAAPKNATFGGCNRTLAESLPVTDFDADFIFPLSSSPPSPAKKQIPFRCVKLHHRQNRKQRHKLGRICVGRHGGAQPLDPLHTIQHTRDLMEPMSNTYVINFRTCPAQICVACIVHLEHSKHPQHHQPQPVCCFVFHTSHISAGWLSGNRIMQCVCRPLPIVKGAALGLHGSLFQQRSCRNRKSG
jgi:hypothetical protein